VQITPEAKKHVLRNLVELYRHDLSIFDDAMPDDSGRFGTDPYFDCYWTDTDRHPFTVLINGKVAGFALVRELGPDCYSIAEFFIVRSCRKRGAGRAVAHQLFRMFPGEWHIAQQELNLPAQHFWRRIIDEFSQGDYEEQWSNKQPRGPKQIFRS